MISIKANLKFPNGILSIEIVDDIIYIIDNKSRLFTYSITKGELENKYILLDNAEIKHIYNKTVAISKSLDFYTSFFDSNKGSVFNIKDDALIQGDILEFNKKNVSYCKFSHDSKLLLIGGNCGTVFFYNQFLKKSLYSLPSRSDTINCASFSSDNKLVCIGAFDKILKIYDISKYEEVASIEISDTVEELLFLDDDSSIVGITRDHKIFTFDIKNNVLVYSDSLFDEWPTSIVKVGQNHLLVGTRGKYLHIFKADTLQLMQKFKTGIIGVKTLKVNQDNIYVGHITGELKIINMNYLYEEYKIQLKLHKYADSTELIKKNIFLITKEITNIYDTSWKSILSDAKYCMSNNKMSQAKALATPFLWDNKKKDEFKFLGHNITSYKQFESLVDRNKNVQAYKLSDEKEFLQQTNEYTILEKAFTKLCQDAMSLFQKDTVEGDREAKDLINPYLCLESKRTLITNIVFKHKIFMRSRILIKSRNFKLYFNLVSKNEYLKDEDLYSKILNIGNSTYCKLLEHEQKEEYDSALEISKYLQDFTPFKDKAIAIENKISSMVELKSLILAEDTQSVYKKVLENKDLELSNIFMQYHKSFEMKKDKAIVSAGLRDVIQVKKLLCEYTGIPYLLNSLLVVYKFLYITQIEEALSQSQVDININLTIEKYTTLFGCDSDISSLTDKFNLSDTLQAVPKNNIDFKDIVLFDTILMSN
jgi:WD40 repeat protein